MNVKDKCVSFRVRHHECPWVRYGFTTRGHATTDRVKRGTPGGTREIDAIRLRRIAPHGEPLYAGGAAWQTNVTDDVQGITGGLLRRRRSLGCRAS